MKSRVTEVVFALLKLCADPFLLGDVPVQLFYVTFGLFRARAFGFGAGALSFSSFTFSLFRLFGAGFNLVEILVIGEVNDRNDRGADDQNREAGSVETNWKRSPPRCCPRCK